MFSYDTTDSAAIEFGACGEQKLDDAADARDERCSNCITQRRITPSRSHIAKVAFEPRADIPVVGHDETSWRNLRRFTASVRLGLEVAAWTRGYNS